MTWEDVGMVAILFVVVLGCVALWGWAAGRGIK